MLERVIHFISTNLHDARLVRGEALSSLNNVLVKSKAS